MGGVGRLDEVVRLGGVGRHSALGKLGEVGRLGGEGRYSGWGGWVKW